MSFPDPTNSEFPASYRESGIDDLAEFYATKFLSTEILDPRYFRPLDRFDMRLARTLWVYDNVREGSTLLDVGCGVGLLALLKRKNVRLSGIDISDECVGAAKSNGYDDVRLGKLTELPFDDQSFDYVASLDVIGHVAFEEKDEVLAEIKRVLKPAGVTLHGIECFDPSVHKPYAEMAPDELRDFVAVDGHIGLERAEEHAERFGKFFKHVAYEPRYILCLSSEEFVKQADEYGLPFDADLVDYLRGLSFRERRAFDMAMGYVFNRISDLHIKLPSAGLYTFLKASDAELGPFYNEHRDRTNLLGSVTTPGVDRAPVARERFHLDLSPGLDSPVRAEFDDGWYPPDILPPVARWMGEHGRIKFVAGSVRSISLNFTTHLPDLSPAKPLELHFALNGVELACLSVFKYGWLEIRLSVPDGLRGPEDGVFELSIAASRTSKPEPAGSGMPDDRELSIAVCNIEVRTDPGG